MKWFSRLEYILHSWLKVGHVSEASVPKVWVCLAFRPHGLRPLLLCAGGHRKVVFHRRIVLDAFVLLGLHLKSLVTH